MNKKSAEKSKNKACSIEKIFCIVGIFYVVVAIMIFLQDGSNNPMIPFTTTSGILLFNFAILFRKGLLRPKTKNYKPNKEYLFIIGGLTIYAILTIFFSFSQKAESSLIIQLLLQIVLPVSMSILFAVGIDLICENTKKVLCNSHNTTKPGHGRK